MAWHVHIALPGATPDARGRLKARCGYDGISTILPADAASSRVSCPKCRVGLARDRLDARPADAPELKLVIGDKDPYGNKRNYLIWFGGAHVGYIAFEGRGWHVHSIRIGENGLPRKGPALGRAVDSRGELTCRTKEDALLEAERLVAEGRLKTLAQTISDREKWRSKLLAADAAIKAEREARHEELQIAREAVASLLARIDLTNAERAGLAAAQKILART